MDLRGAVRSSLAVLVLLSAASAVAQAGDAGTAPSEGGEGPRARVSYAFPVDLAGSRPPSLAAPGSATCAGATCAEPGPPDPDALAAALRRAVREFLADARDTYGSPFDDLRYDTRIAGRELAGDRAVQRVTYEGSVREIASGRRVATSGIATLRLRWTGCAWRRTGLSYGPAAAAPPAVGSASWRSPGPPSSRAYETSPPCCSASRRSA